MIDYASRFFIKSSIHSKIIKSKNPETNIGAQIEVNIHTPNANIPSIIPCLKLVIRWWINIWPLK